MEKQKGREREKMQAKENTRQNWDLSCELKMFRGDEVANLKVENDGSWG